MDKEIDKKVRGILLEEYKGITDLRDEINKHFLEIRTHNLLQRRDLMKHIILISAAVLGLLALGTDDGIIKNYFFLGVSLHAFVVFFLIVRLREQIDLDANELKLEQAKYNRLSENKRDIIEKYLMQENPVDYETLSKYFDDLNNNPDFEKFYEEGKEVNRKPENINLLDFSLEIAIFAFVTGSFFVMAALFKQYINNYILVATIFASFIISFTSSSTLITRLIGLLLIPVVKIGNWLQSKRTRVTSERQIKRSPNRS